MKLIVGLGNPGLAYARNRHNVGFMCLNRLARIHELSFNTKRGQSRLAVGKIADKEVILARPQTYMNLSGEAVKLLLHRFNISLQDLIVIHDDLDLPPGKIRIRQRGGSGGHKGVESIIQCLASDNFSRIRVGIGHPDGMGEVLSSEETAAYVLSNFHPDERIVIKEAINRVAEAVYCILTEGIAAAMTRYN
jgi:PTH1 family peptidyl-tRNA hydrolase